MNNKPYTQDEFVNKINLINPKIDVLGTYVSSHLRIDVRCKVCNKEWSPQAYQLIQGHGCPECGKKLATINKKGKTAKKTTEQFIKELNSVYDTITVVGEYEGSKTKIAVCCDVCGLCWESTPYMLLNGAGCPACYKVKRKSYRRYTPESYKNSVYQRLPNIELLSDFTKSTERVEVKCKVCGYKWSPKAYTLLQDRGCAICGRKNGILNNHGKTGLKTTKKFISELNNVDNSIEVIGEYINNHTDVECKCKRCDHTWRAKPYSLLQGRGCPRCSRSGTSFMEQLILLSFRKLLGDKEVISRDKSLIGMELDIVIPKFNLAIEPGNWYLHHRSLKRDTEKRIRCKNQGYQLITIYDVYPKDTKPPFQDNCYVFPEDLNVVNHAIIHNLIRDLLALCDINCQFSNNDWEQLEESAYANSKSMTHEQFVERLSSIRPDIEVIGKYFNSNRRLAVRCKKCGFVWNGVPASLLAGDGCRKCGAKLRGDRERKNQYDFEIELATLIPTIKIIGTYISRHSPIKVQCLVCGNIWEPTPGSLLRKKTSNNSSFNGCPKCAKTKCKVPVRKVLNQDTGEVFSSAAEAGEKYGIVPSAIRHCCLGITKTSNGFHWMYLEDSSQV